MTFAELRAMQGSFSPKRKFFWYQEYRDRDGCDRKYYNVAVCDDDHEVTAVERRVGFHHWLSEDEIMGILGADIHTCTPKEFLKQALKEQDQSTDSNPIGYLLWDAGLGWWEFVEEEPVDYYDYKAVYANPPEPARKPMTEDEIKDIYYNSGITFEATYLAAFVKGVRQSEKFHGIGGGDE
jgi:hypothetical protein